MSSHVCFNAVSGHVVNMRARGIDIVVFFLGQKGRFELLMSPGNFA